MLVLIPAQWSPLFMSHLTLTTPTPQSYNNIYVPAGCTVVFSGPEQTALRNFEKHEIFVFPHVILIITLRNRFYCPDLADERLEASETYIIGKLQHWHLKPSLAPQLLFALLCMMPFNLSEGRTSPDN